MLHQSKGVPYRFPFQITLGETSATLFNIFLNGLANEMEMSDVGIKLDQLLSILLYSDDIVILVQNKSDLQKVLDIIYS